MPEQFTLNADDVDVSELFEGSSQFTVPDYQREYSWGDEQLGELWDDITALTRSRDNHYLGSIIIIEKTGNEIKQQELVDGQQRLTTISLILTVIRDYFESQEDHDFDNVPELVDNFLFTKSNVTGDKHQKLRLNKYHNDAFEKVLAGFSDSVDDDSPIKEAYNFYWEKIDGVKPEKVEKIRRAIIQSISLVEIECGSEANAFRLFESVNNRGLDLSPVDLVKNRIFMYANHTSSVDENRVKDLWDDIITTIRPELRQEYRFFTHYCMSATTPETRDNVSKRLLYDYFNELIDHRLDEVNLSIEELLDDMAKTSKLYVDILNCEVSEDFQRGKLEKLNNKLEAVQIKNERIRTLLLRIIQDYESADDVIEALSILEVLNIRAKVTGRDSNTSRDRFWSRTSSQLNKENNKNQYLRRLVRSRASSDTVLIDRMQDREFKRNDFTKYILDQIEQRYYMKSSGKTISGRSTVDIEEIAPRKAFTAKKYSPWKQYLDCTQEEFEEYKNRIGNLTLLESSLNRAVGDDPYDYKRQHYLNDTEFKMAVAVAEEYEEWDIEKIKDRSKEMAKITAEIWSIDNV
ncbi:ParB-like nuclease domain containing protein fused to HNH nuclease [Halapricum desulfuricans]|uniref:ParB-like nuclease domain containing protein fused to HNH nuclease n=1 Tax=Halapricum desulfuricans TaxID=2841257 RepID=A0A897NNM3_9EURY|nr:DUF262 domain-containing protein [Halapricum desulfuricans]QSG11816.1 ParB-like nuclease domain containing protein fused to HNH nuclease [Halapricum desulfuricans]